MSTRAGTATPLAVVTGASTGSGRATAERLAARELHAVLVGRTSRTLEDTCSAITEVGGAGGLVVCAAYGDRWYSHHPSAAMIRRTIASPNGQRGRDLRV